MEPINVHDVAAYILGRGTLSAMRLQKLVYYSQAWSLVWDERPLFPEPIEAWANGPVVPELYTKHRGEYLLSKWPCGHPEKLDSTARETIDLVLESYLPLNAQQLSDLTHTERPWREARAGLDDGLRGNNQISHESMAEYYSSLQKNGEEFS